MSEAARLQWLKRNFPAANADLGIGDDGLVSALSPAHELVLSTDAAVEGVHFRSDWLDDHAVGYRAARAALSDLAAMGAQPRGLTLSLTLPKDWPDSRFEPLVQGVASAGAAVGAPLLGGNLTTAPFLSATFSVFGEVPTGAALTRSGAQPGEKLWVSGPVGRTALGLAALQQGVAERAFVDAWRTPPCRIDAGLVLRGCASAAIDISDGLVLDASRLADASQVDVDIESSRLGIAADAWHCAERLGVDARRLALSGGEDYELLFSLPDGSEPAIAGARCIGHITAGEGRVRVDGQPLGTTSGWDPFTP